jgi:2-oxoisovalerate dehydrogenase E1 component
MKLHNFNKKELIDVYEKMVTSRFLDDKMLIMLKQGKSWFHIGASGHEAAQLAASICFNSDLDYAYPYYRDQAFCLGWGATAQDLLMCFLHKEDDPNSGGRQMPQHYGNKALNIVSQSSCTGTQYLQAVGTAFGLQRDGNNGVCYVSSGEGTTSEGDFHEALNWASKDKAPVIFHIQDNGYAISVPIKEQTSGESVYNICSGYENLSRFDVDGTNFFESQLAFKKAIERARKGLGPSVIVSKVVRLLPHSSSDDQRKYRTEKDLEKDKKSDPLLIFQKKCIQKSIITEKEFLKIENKVKKNIEDEVDYVETQANPSPESAMMHLFSESTDLDSSASFKPKEVLDKIVMVDSINHALSEELDFNDKMLIYGEDVGGDKGGVFTATRGLAAKFGDNRVFNSPLAESSIVGTAIGLSIMGYKPVVEIQFGDYIWPAMMQIRNEVATMRYRSNGNWSCPLVIRVPVGGYIHGSIYHSQSIDGYFVHTPGLKVVYPSNASDAKGLLKYACRCDDPVLFFEHKGIYRQGFASSPEPTDDFLLPFGKARIVQEGTDLTIVTWGAIVQKSVEASRNTNKSIEIIDIRTLNPLDIDTILDSIKKTNRVIVAHEDHLTSGFGAEISAQIADIGFEFLDAPVKRVASKDVHIAYSPNLENEILVQTDWIEEEIEEILKY